jgi:hypothetical protein
MEKLFFECFSLAPLLFELVLLTQSHAGLHATECVLGPCLPILYTLLKPFSPQLSTSCGLCDPLIPSSTPPLQPTRLFCLSTDFAPAFLPPFTCGGQILRLPIQAVTSEGFYTRSSRLFYVVCAPFSHISPLPVAPDAVAHRPGVTGASQTLSFDLSIYAAILIDAASLTLSLRVLEARLLTMDSPFLVQYDCLAILMLRSC